LGRLVGGALEQRDLRRFERALETRGPSPATVATALPPVDPRAVDQRHWDDRRIRAYFRALNEEAPPPLAVLRVPRIGLEVPVLAGTDEWTLDRAVGWIEGTARPGERGNVGIAGHRDGFFRGLKDVKTGDTLELITLSGAQDFRIEEIRIVSPHDVHVLDPADVPTMTLVTCFPFYFVGSAPKRFIVRAVLSSARGAMPREPRFLSK
jgi:sortase A